MAMSRNGNSDSSAVGHRRGMRQVVALVEMDNRPPGSDAGEVDGFAKLVKASLARKRRRAPDRSHNAAER